MGAPATGGKSLSISGAGVGVAVSGFALAATGSVAVGAGAAVMASNAPGSAPTEQAQTGGLAGLAEDLKAQAAEPPGQAAAAPEATPAAPQASAATAAPPPKAKGGANGSTQAAASRGSTLHSDKPGMLPDQLRARYPQTQFSFTKPGVKGQDVRVVGGKHPSEYPDSTWPSGIDHADFKPGTATGSRTFKADQKHKWSEPTTMLPYDPSTGTLK